MGMREEGYERGYRAGEAAKGTIADQMKNYGPGQEFWFTAARGMDFAAEIEKWDRKRLDSGPSLIKYPEIKGLRERHLGEREGFMAGADCTYREAAFHYSSRDFRQRVLNVHYIGPPSGPLPPPPPIINPMPDQQCTNVFIPNGVEGITTGNNRDDTVWTYQMPKFRPPKGVCREMNYHLSWGSVSSAVRCDEPSDEIFPVDVFEILPDECTYDIKNIVKFFDRYVQFWGPANMIFADREFRAVAAEKTNNRVGWRWPDETGAVAITACSYLDPEIYEFKRSRLRKQMELLGETEETSWEWNYDIACHKRYERLIKLTREEAKRGATLWGVFNIVADPDGKPPERITVAGERTMPDYPEKEQWGPHVIANWTIVQHASVVTGPNRRTLWRHWENWKPVDHKPPYLVLGEGVEMKPEWKTDLDDGRCRLWSDSQDPVC